jgi:hypothetical protein
MRNQTNHGLNALHLCLTSNLSFCIEPMHYLEQTCFSSCRYTPSSTSFSTFGQLASLYEASDNYLEKIRAVEHGTNEKELEHG